MEWIKDLIGSLDSVHYIVLSVVVCYNALLTAASTILEHFKKSLNENHWLFKVSDILNKIVDFLSANKKHK